MRGLITLVRNQSCAAVSGGLRHKSATSMSKVKGHSMRHHSSYYRSEPKSQQIRQRLRASFFFFRQCGQRGNTLGHLPTSKLRAKSSTL